MRNVYLADLINRVRVRADQETSNGALAFIDDPTIGQWLEDHYCELYDLLIKTSENYNLKEWDFQTVSGTADYALPPDFYKLLGVDVQNGSTFFECERMQFSRRNDYNYAGTTPLPGAPQFYDLRGNRIHFMPVPSGYPARLYYYPAPPKFDLTVGDNALVNEAHVFFDGIAGWEKYVVDSAARDCAIKDENFDLANTLAGDVATQRQRIISMASARDAGAAPRVRQVRGHTGGRYGRRGRWGGGSGFGNGVV